MHLPGNKVATKSKFYKIGLSALVAGTALIMQANAAGYDHDDWPVVPNTTGGWEFKESAKTNATPICAAYYVADVNSQQEFNNGTSVFGTLVMEHSTHMRDAYAENLNDDSAIEARVKDMTWHFANAAQYGAFQEFKDSANGACETHALQTGVVSQDYLDTFNQRMNSALGGL